MIRLACCSGEDAERFNATRDHASVFCTACGVRFCLDWRDVEAEEWYSKHYEEADGSRHRRARVLPQRPWYCSLACLNHRRAGLAGTRATEPREDLQERLLP